MKEPESGSATTATFVGIPKNGIINFTMVKGGGNLADPKRGYTLVGNPYPSNIDLVLWYSANRGAGGNFDSTVYFWDNRANSQTEQAGASYGGQAYAIFNMLSLGASVATGDSLLVGIKTPTRYVKTGQGFMVKSKAASASLLFNNSIRNSQNGAVNFFGKNGGFLEEVRDKFWLNMIGPINIVANMNVVYFPEGNNAFAQDDSRSMGGSDAIYSLVDNEQVGINGRSAFVETDVIPLGSQHFARGNYTIELSSKEGVFGHGQNIYLKDIQLGIITDLNEGNYTFEANAGESSGRFEIIYKPESVIPSDSIGKHDVTLYKDGSDFVVKSSCYKITKLEIFDSSGRLVEELTPDQTEVRISAAGFSNGLYVLKIMQDQIQTVKKIIK